MTRIMFVSSTREHPSTFTRDGSAWLNGTAFGRDQPRVFNAVAPVLLIEPASTNLFLHSEAPVEQVITTTGLVTVNTRGIGRVLLNGGALGVVMQDRPVTVDWPGSVTVTPDGALEWVQVEPGALATSHIPTGGVPVARAAEALSLDADVSGVLNVAGVLQPNRSDFLPWLTAGSLSIGQAGRAVRVTIGAEEALLPAPMGWSTLTLLQADSGVLVAHNNRVAAHLTSELNAEAPIEFGGGTFVSFSSLPHRVPHINPDGTRWQHTEWLASLKRLGVEPRPLNVMSLDLSQGNFYAAIW